jgi:hypothetical protein
MTDIDRRPEKLPPAWFKHAFWRVHRALCRFSGGRFLWTPIVVFELSEANVPGEPC